MPKLTFTLSLLLTSFAKADIIKCVFTEPFINTTYSMTQSTLTYTGIDHFKKVYKNVSFQIKAPGVFELVRHGVVMQTLKLTFHGSDGMSDLIYPYEVKDSHPILTPTNGIGGCTSNYLHTTEPTSP